MIRKSKQEKTTKTLKHSKEHKFLNKKNIIIAISALLIIFLGIKFVSSQLNDERLADDYSVNSNQKRLTNKNSSNTSKKESLYKNDSERLKLSKDRINFLFAGIGGDGHDGGYLTDTIIFASIDTKTSQLAMLSIPRDLYVDLGEDYGYWKINSANAFGEEIKPGKGMEFTREIVEQITAQPIQYYVRLDFNGFESIVDTLGGIGVNVERGFVDEQYPTENYGYKTISFEPGYQIMDGATALEYARSRHGNNGEDSDFARSTRQMKIILGIKEKATSLGTLMNPTKLISLMSELNRNIETNISVKDVSTLYKIVKNVDISNSISRSLSDTSGYVYITKTAAGASIVKPTGNNYDLIQGLAENIFDKNYSIKSTQIDLPYVIVLNGTNKAGLASRVGEQVKNTGDFQVLLVGNANNRNQSSTLIYDISENVELDEIINLNQKIKGKIISTRLNLFNSDINIPLTTTADIDNLETLKKTYTSADLVIILGNDFVENL